MSIQRIQGVEIIDNGVLDGVPKINRQQRCFMEARNRKIAAVGAVTQRASTMHRLGHEQILEETRQGITNLNAHDSWVEQLGSNAVETHAVVKNNYYQTQMEFLQQLNGEVRTLLEDLLDEIATLPDAFWYDHSSKDQFVAGFIGTYLDLEDRGLPQLTFRESLKQLLTGNVVLQRTAAFDQAQVKQRRMQRDEMRAIAAQRAAALASLMTRVEEVPDVGLTSEEREALLQEAFRRRTAHDQAWNDEEEASDVEVIDKRR